MDWCLIHILNACKCWTKEITFNCYISSCYVVVRNICSSLEEESARWWPPLSSLSFHTENQSSFQCFPKRWPHPFSGSWQFLCCLKSVRMLKITVCRISRIPSPVFRVPDYDYRYYYSSYWRRKCPFNRWQCSIIFVMQYPRAGRWYFFASRNI